MDLHNNPNLGTGLLETKIKQLEDRLDKIGQTVGLVQNTVEAFSSEIQTVDLTAQNTTTENLTVNGHAEFSEVVFGESIQADSATFENVKTTTTETDEITSLNSSLGDATANKLELSGNLTAAGSKVLNLIQARPIATTQYVGYDDSGNLIPVDPTKGVAKWENKARANTIVPVDNAKVEIPTELSLPSLDTELMTDTQILSVDAGGKVVKKDASATLQKKLVPGYNISIDEETNEISCDIKTMTFCGSVETYEELPETDVAVGDVWNVTATNQNYCWDGESWIIVGSSVDLTNYYTKSQVYSKSETYPKTELFTKSESETNFVNRTFGTTATASDEQIKTVSIPDITTLNAGCEIKIQFVNENKYGSCVGTSSNLIAQASAPQIKLNNFAAYPIKVGGEYAGEGFIRSGDVHTFVFDGSAWNDMTADVIYQGETTAGSYVKKRNGIIEQWKKQDTTSMATYTWYFPIIFSNTNYFVSNEGVTADRYINYVHVSDTNPGTNYKCNTSCLVIGN